jgi:hypothetical protein
VLENPKLGQQKWIAFENAATRNGKFAPKTMGLPDNASPGRNTGVSFNSSATPAAFLFLLVSLARHTFLLKKKRRRDDAQSSADLAKRDQN